MHLVGKEDVTAYKITHTKETKRQKKKKEKINKIKRQRSSIVHMF